MGRVNPKVDFAFKKLFGVEENKDILKDFIDRDGVKTTIFYYDKQQQTQQIANLVKMLGQEHFIKMINNVPQQITFIKQQGMIDAS